MIHSMTGFGQALRAYDEYQLQIEIKSVNHRYLEMNIRLPRQWLRLEDAVKQKLRTQIQRGKIDAIISIVRQTGDHHEVALNWPLAQAYYEAAQQLRAKFGLADTLTIQDFLQIPDLIKVEEVSGVDNPLMQEQLLICLDAALLEVNQMRQTEGRFLQADLKLRLNALQDLHQSMRILAPKVVDHYQQKLRSRLKDTLEGIEYDEQRLLQEVLYQMDRTNIDEELTRLESHFQQFSQLLHAGEPVGRKLDFILQEINREVNTIGSKANDSNLVNSVVNMKSELEKMREQVQNIQ